QTQNRGRGPAPFQNSNQNRNQNFPQGRARQQQQNAEPVPPPPTPVGKPIAIRFKPMGEFYFLYDEGLELKPREKVIVKISKGKDIAEVAMIEFPQEFKVTDPQLRILRRVNDADISQQERNAQREKEAFGICLSKIKKLELPMKLLAVKYIFDGSRITFYFKADSKVDFRKLVRELAAIFRTRIELRQIGPRDETELFGGLGVCGRRVCCTYWCCKAKPVINVDSPKTPFAGLQGMSNKALGLCSRPLCCLRYEGDAEPCCKIALPAVNSKIVIDEQNGVLKLIDIKANQVCIQIDGEEVELNISYEDFLLKLNEGKAKKI
ncbi:MAG: Stage 0 sporulation family protein, partial [uncultured bacterium]